MILHDATQIIKSIKMLNFNCLSNGIPFDHFCRWYKLAVGVYCYKCFPYMIQLLSLINKSNCKHE